MYSEKVGSLTSSVSRTSKTGWHWNMTKRLPYLPRFCCVAPEIVNEFKVTVKSDVFSIARTMHLTLKHFHKTLDLKKDILWDSTDEYHSFINDLRKYRKENNTSEFMKNIDSVMIESLYSAYNVNHKERLEISKFIKCKYFNTMLTRVLAFLDALPTKKDKAKLNFLKRLPGVE